MITHVKGTVSQVGEHVTVLLPVGIAFAVYTVQPLQFALGATVEFFTHLHWNQEDGPTLYGFKTAQERAFFVLAIGCSGIGPKIALAILEQTSIAEFAHAIQTLDYAWLSKLKGIGSKKAEQLVIQLKSKIDTFVERQAVTMHGASAHAHQLTQALQSLNYSRSEIMRAVAHVQQTSDETLAFEVCLRNALLFLAQR